MNKAELLSELGTLFFRVGTPVALPPKPEWTEQELVYYRVPTFDLFEEGLSIKDVNFWVFREGVVGQERAFWHGGEPNNFLKRLQAYMASMQGTGGFVTGFRMETDPQMRTARILAIFEGPTPPDDYVTETHFVRYDPVADTWFRRKIG